MGLTNTGHKQTEIGIIPNNWELKTYGECFDFLSTATYSRAELTDNDEVQYVHYGDIHTRWNFVLDISKSFLPTIPPNKVKNYNLVKDGDVIMADASEDYEGVGKSVEVKNVENKRIIAGLHTFLLRDSNQQIEPGFKAYLHINSLVKKQFDRLATGMKVYGVSKNNLKKVLIPLPKDKSEQTAIATTLSDVDALIENLEKLITKKRNIKQGVMQELLTGEKRLKGFNNKWLLKRIGEIAEIKKGQLITQETATIGSIPVIAGGITPSYYHNQSNRNANTITVSASGANAGYVAFHSYPIFASDCSTITENDSFDIRFLYYSLLLNQQKIFKLQTGGAQPHVYPEQLKVFKILYPNSKDEQNAISAILSDLDTEIFSFEKKLSKYKTLKQGMMQTLLTGKIRLI